eukprot:6542336-Ditylum_brightwellii.AAC.1
MAIVASNMMLHTTFMRKAKTPVAFCCTFQANVDTINAHGRCAGRHPKLLNEHVECLISKRGLDNNSYTNDLKKMVDGTRA